MQEVPSSSSSSLGAPRTSAKKALTDNRPCHGRGSHSTAQCESVWRGQYGSSHWEPGRGGPFPFPFPRCSDWGSRVSLDTTGKAVSKSSSRSSSSACFASLWGGFKGVAVAREWKWLLVVLCSGNVPIFFSFCLLVHRIQGLIVLKINFCRQFLLVLSPSRRCCGCLLGVKGLVVYPCSVVAARYIINIKHIHYGSA